MPRTVQKILYVLAGTVTLLAIYLAIKYVMPEMLEWLLYLTAVLFPFLLAVIFSIFMEPLVVFFGHNGRVSRAAAVPVAMLVFFGGISTILTLVIFRLVKELSDLSVMLPQKVPELQYFFDLWVKKSIIFYGTLPKSVTENLQQSLNNVTTAIEHWAGELVSVLLAVISGIPGAIMVILVSLVATYFFSKDREKIARLWLRVAPPPWGARVLEVSKQVALAFQSYIRAQFILVSITAFLSIIGLHFIGASYALTIGLLIGFLDMIPVLGPGTIYIPWAIWAFVAGNVLLGVELTVLYLLVMVVRALLEAKIVAANLGLHPLAVLVAMFVGLKTIGVIGLILGPMLVITIQAAVKAGNPINK
ncbi:sporulation integral membrane protein YtvI [Desulfoscipio sp. XC116]|uniref:sporulation integral membrane protein YtvI n=1 Tax=Desulfoscipio sp. XC116 TaxID=3144975 RepID=UPI00325B1160